MPKIIPVALFVALAAITVSAPLSAQGRSTVDATVLNAAVAELPTTRRAAVAAVLTSDRAVAVAKRLGLSAEDVSARVAALDDQSVQQLDDRILAGGDSTVVIRTTTIIIVLLVLILLTT